MEDYKTEIEELVDDIKEYVNTSAEIYKMKASAQAARAGASTMIGIVVGILATVAFLFFSFAAAFSISSWLNTQYSGFLVIGALYGIIALVISAQRNKGLRDSLTDKFIKHIYSDDHQ
ncbi:MAG TPA: phage holin family protein [Bacteroidia bacterium]|nr:phage holin family protein [Bacteroidia bacterium]